MDSSRLVTLYKESNGLAVRNSYIGDQSSDVDMSGASNMFGSIASNRLPFSTSMDFIPQDGNGNLVHLRGTNANPQWLGLQSIQMQFWAYVYCSPLAAVIDRLAEADTNGRIELANPDGTVNKNYTKNPTLYRMMKLLANPNPLQTWEEFNSQQVVICKTFGYCPVFAICPFGFDKSYSTSLWNLNPYFVTPTYNINYDAFDPNSNPISKWTANLFGSRIEIDGRDVMILKDGFVDQITTSLSLPLSKIAGLDYFVSNICAAMEADNVLLKKKGPLGVFSYDPKPDMAGWKPMLPDQQKEIQSDLKRYGMTWGQLQYIVSKLPIKWNSMSFNVQELMTKETVRQGIDGICDRFGYPAELMSGKNATYENRNSAEKFLYQNNVIPFSLRRMARYCKFFNISGLRQSFDHLPVLQDDILKAGQSRFAKSQALDIDWKNGIITWNEYRQLQGMDTETGGDIYYPDWLKQNPTMVPQTTTTNKKNNENIAS